MAQTPRSGFSLIEIVLYLGVGAILLGAVTSFYFSLEALAVKNQTILEVEEVGQAALAVMLQSVRSAVDVNGLARGVTANDLSLRFADSSRNPTVFNVANGALRIREGRSNGPVALTPPRLRVTRFSVRNVASPGGVPVVRLELGLASVNPSGRNEYEYTQTFLGTAVLRP